jgi:hypothetical protein
MNAYEKYISRFVAARMVGTPGVAIRTPDATSTIANVKKAIVTGMSKVQAEKELTETPIAQWDRVRGLRGVNDAGSAEISKLLGGLGVQVPATVEPHIAIAAVEEAAGDLILFIHNAHLYWEDPAVLQATLNLRDKYKANGNMIVLMIAPGVNLPPELNNDFLLLEEPLPSRAEIKSIVKGLFEFANCTKHVTEEILQHAADALVGIAAFPAEQAAAMALNKKTGFLDIKEMWSRKKDIISATAGFSFYDGPLKLIDAGGLKNIKEYLTALMKGKRGANIILRLDEIEKAFAGSQTDSSGVKGELLGNFLTWVEDKKIICCLFLGVPGASKSHIIYCLGGEFGIPVLNFDIAGMQDMHVGNSGKNLNVAERTVEAISDGQIILLATANSLRGLPAELISRFERGGIFFFDAPDAGERKIILDLKIAAYNLTDKQTAEIPDMTGWTGREIDAMCNNADMLNKTLTEAAQYVVPLTKSHAESINELRNNASQRYLSASHAGLYKWTPAEVAPKPEPTVAAGRKFRATPEDKTSN